jgi:hypothetical protein
MKRAMFSMFWIGAVIIVATEASWYYEVFRRPLGELRELLGAVPDGARTVGYLNEASVRGGTIRWNIVIAEGAARGLRSRCSGSAKILPLVRLRVAETSTGTRIEGPLASMTQGCTIAARNGPYKTYSGAVLGDRLIQLTVALD